MFRPLFSPSFSSEMKYSLFSLWLRLLQLPKYTIYSLYHSDNPPPCEIWMNLTYIYSFAMLTSAILIKMEMFFSPFVGVAIYNPDPQQTPQECHNFYSTDLLVWINIRATCTNTEVVLCWSSAPLCVSLGREGCGDSLSPERHSLHRWRAGPLPFVCTAGLPPAFQPGTGHLCLVMPYDIQVQAGGFLHCAFVNKRLQMSTQFDFI